MAHHSSWKTLLITEVTFAFFILVLHRILYEFFVLWRYILTTWCSSTVYLQLLFWTEWLQWGHVKHMQEHFQKCSEKSDAAWFKVLKKLTQSRYLLMGPCKCDGWHVLGLYLFATLFCVMFHRKSKKQEKKFAFVWMTCSSLLFIRPAYFQEGRDARSPVCHLT